MYGDCISFKWVPIDTYCLFWWPHVVTDTYRSSTCEGACDGNAEPCYDKFGVGVPMSVFCKHISWCRLILRCFYVVLVSQFDLSVKWMVTFLEVVFHSLNNYGQFSVVIWLLGSWDFANWFWLKILVLPMGMMSLRGLIYTSCLWEWFEILYHLCEWGFTFENLQFVMKFYSALLALKTDWMTYFFAFSCLKLLHLGPRVYLQWYHIRFLSREYWGFSSTCDDLEFWNFEEWANRANVFPVLLTLV